MPENEGQEIEITLNKLIQNINNPLRGMLLTGRKGYNQENMNNFVKKSLLILYHYLGPLILLAAVTWILKGFETSLQIQLIALLYLLPVLLSTALWGLWPGLLS